MAGGKLSPRQKMINLMYLVFIAMLAMNMSKEVLSAFGIMNKKLTDANVKTSERNTLAYASMELKATENAEGFGKNNEGAKAIKQLSSDYNSYLTQLRSEMLATVEDPSDYEIMDKADHLDELFFKGDNYTTQGQEFVAKLQEYRDGVSAVLDSFPDLKASVITRFDTGDENGKVRNRDNRPVDWLDYHFKGYPMVASLTKVTQLQTDVKTTEEDVLNSMLAGALSELASMDNYTTLLEQPKSAYYSGERFDGNIVLGRKDNSTRPNRVEITLDGRELEADKDFLIEDGRVKLTVSAGSPGDHKLEGKLIFDQDGEEIEVPVEATFATISKPNAAVISADKMNVVYRGVANPMTISIPGIPDSKVRASAPGLSKRSGSRYTMNPGKGRTVSISASGTLPDGQGVKSTTEFRIKDIPRPFGTIRGEFGEVKMTKNNLEISTVGAILDDFDFDLNLKISGFKFKVPGQPTVQVRGGKLDARAKSTLRRAKRGDAVQFFDIAAYITNNRSYKLKKVSPVMVELTN